MSPEEAIRVLDQATAQISTNRENHALIQQALTVLEVAIKPVDKPEK